MILGGVGIWYGVKEYRVGADASAEPVPVELADLEAGKSLPNNHIRIGPHYQMYPASVYQYEYKDDDDRVRPTSKVNWTYVPLISDDHPFMQQIRALAEKYGDLDKVPENADWPALNDFAVLLKTTVYKTVGDIPDLIEGSDSVTGLVINEIDALGKKEKELIRSGITGVDVDKVLILHHKRRPQSAILSLGIIFGGVLLIVAPVGYLIWSLRRPTIPPAPETASEPGEEPPAAEGEPEQPAPPAPQEPAEPQAALPPDRNPYRGE